MKDDLNNKIKPYIENGNYIVRNYNEENTSLRERMNTDDYHFHIKTADNIFVFTTLTQVIEMPLKDFDWHLLWERLGDIPINENDELEENYLHFDVGTDNQEVWHWFEWFFDISLGKELF